MFWQILKQLFPSVSVLSEKYSPRRFAVGKNIFHYSPPLQGIIVNYTILYYTILYYTILYYTILYYTMLYYTILYYIMLCYVILYSVLFYSILFYYINNNRGIITMYIAKRLT